MDYVVGYGILLLVGMAVSALYSGLETGIYSMSALRIQLLSDQKTQARKLAKIIQKPQEMVTATLIGINVAHFLCEVTTIAILKFYSFSHVEILSTILLAPLLFIFAEIIPKELFRRHSDSLMPWFRPALQFSYWIFFPLVVLLLGVGKFLSFLFQQDAGQYRLTKQRIRHYFLEKGGLSSDQTLMAENIFHLEDILVNQVKQPLKKVRSLHKKTTREEFLRQARIWSHTRYPIYEVKKNNFLGVVHLYDVLFDQEELFSLEKHIRPLLSIPGSATISEGLKTLQKAPMPMAIVVDRHGKPVGIVTLKDLLEGIVGLLKDW